MHWARSRRSSSSSPRRTASCSELRFIRHCRARPGRSETRAIHTLTPADRRDRRFGWLMASPSLAILFLVILFPVFWALFTSLHDYTLIAPNFDTFTGIGNFTKAIGEAEFRHTLWLTAFFVLAVVLLEFALGFLVALMLNSVERFKPIYYAILLCPLLMNPVIVGLIWRMFLHPSLGIVNYLLSTVGIDPVNWL